MAGAELGQLLHRRVLVDRHAGALCCFAEPPDVLAHVETGALRLDHSAVEGVRSDLATQFALGDQLCVASKSGVQQLGGLLESLEVRRLGRKDQLAGAREVAVDAFLRDELLDQVDRLAVRAVQRRRLVEAHLVHCVPDADRHAGGRHAAVATGGTEPDGVLLEEIDLRSTASQVQGRHDAGQATADDGHVGASFHAGLRSLGGTRGSGVEPVGRELHAYSSDELRKCVDSRQDYTRYGRQSTRPRQPRRRLPRSNWRTTWDLTSSRSS